jgi:glycosyltransferase involved in cell wall biosynthesis
MAATGFEPFDRIHQHTAPAFEYVLAHGADPARHVLLPVAFRLAPELEVPSDAARSALRRRLDLPPDRPIVTSVAALNSWHKRLDYLIEEVARLPEPRPFLLLVGQPEPETERLRELAGERLGATGHSIRTVSRAEVDDLVRASDMFVLASLAEGLPRALVEGLALGLPCLAHDYPIARYALEAHGRFGDFTRPGALSELIAAQAAEGWGPKLAPARHRSVYERFSWDALHEPYVELLRGAVGRAGFDRRPLRPASPATAG